MTGTPIHALLDLSTARLSNDEWAGILRRLSQPDDLGGLAAHITCLVDADMPSAPSETPARWHWTSDRGAAAEALERAGRDGAHLLVLLAPVSGCAEAAVSLLGGFEADPLIGAVHPRFAVAPGGDILPVDAGAPNAAPIPRATLTELPPHYFVAEHLTACFVIRRELLANLDPSASSNASGAAEIHDYLRRARRVGYRSIVLNSAVVTLSPAVAEAGTTLDRVSRGVHWDNDFARARFQRADAFVRERRLAALHERPRRLLFDARNIDTTINGTSKAVLGLADALAAIDDPRWSVTLVASEQAIEAHALDRRFTGWSVEDTLPSEPVAAAFRPCQPWDLHDVIELHRLAALNVYLMLDTIAWDVVYTATRRLDATWRFIAQYADALLFISDFSRQRFLTRFPTHRDVMAEVCHLSLDPADYVDAAAAAGGADEPYWLVFGNDYDHKHVRPTLALLARAFPTTRLITLGIRPQAPRPASPSASGQASETEVQRLYAKADVMVFPSFYEGFGLPIINALAYGRTVIARDSALLREIAATYQGPGRLVPYDTPDELVDRLIGLRRGLTVPELTLQRGTARHSWRAAAQAVVAAIERLGAPHGTRREGARHEAVHLLDAYVDAATPAPAMTPAPAATT